MKKIKKMMFSFLVIVMGLFLFLGDSNRYGVFIEDGEIPLSFGDMNGGISLDKENIMYENVEKLKQADVKHGDVVYTLGFYIANDGGGGEYYISADKKSVYSKTTIELQNGLYAVLVEREEVSVEQFGAHGDGVHDDTLAINNALNSEYNNIKFNNKIYKCNYRIVMNSPNKNVYGNGATLITTNDYKDDSEFFFLIKADNVILDTININANETQYVKYKSQIAIQKSSHIKVNNCKFIIPESVCKRQPDGSKKEYTNIDLYSGWHDVVIKNCELQNYSQCEAGGGVWIRDIWKIGSSDLVLENNIISKSSHDEIIAVFSGSVENVDISNNKIYMYENEVSSSSDFCFLFGNKNSIKCDNIIFENNEIECSACKYFVMFGTSTNVIFRNNHIKFSKIGNDTFYLFHTATGTTPDNDNLIENNNIEIITNIDLKRLFNAPGIYKDNNITMNNRDVIVAFGHSMARDAGNNYIYQ